MAGIPQVITEDRASGAQFIEGSLKFDQSKSNYLSFTPTTTGNRRTWTFSCWFKKMEDSANRVIFSSYGSSPWTAIQTQGSADGRIQATFDAGVAPGLYTNARFRDNGWYHLVWVVDTTQSTDPDKSKLYINGVLQTYGSGSHPSLNEETPFNLASRTMYIGYTPNQMFDGHMSQCYFIDGQALGPENFGYTDPLTNTWRPKKYTGDFNITSSDYTGVFAPYSAISRWNSFKTYTTVNENSTGHTLPMSNPSHYGGKALDLASGGFQVQTNNSAAGDFFMAVWVNLDSYATGKQMGVDIAGNYVYFETQGSGAIKIRHTGSGGATSSSGYANDTNQWQHWALSRSGGSLRAFVDGEQIVTDTGGISGNNTVLSNSKFNFFGADNNTTSYNIDGQVIDAVIYIGQGVSGNFTPPTAPLIDASGNINHYSGFSDSQLYFASPLVDVSGSDPNPSTGYITTGDNSFYLPMDGNTPIGKDQSGKGNDWKPVNFGGSVELPKATGAIPILNTNEAGTVANKGVRTDSKTYTVTASGGNYYLDGALKPTLNAYRGGSYTFDYTGATSHPFYLSSLQDGKWNSKAYSVEFDGTGDSCSIGPSSDFTMGTGDFTIECFVQKDNNSHKGILQISDTAGGFATTNYGTTLAIGYQLGVWQIYGTGNSTPSAESASYPINAGQWYHVAYVRHNSVAKLYVDGVEVISRTDTYNFNGTYIGYGGYYNSSYLHDGKISNLRVVKGQALYTSNFTRPSTTLTTTSQGAIASNVKLICCQDSDATTAAVKPGNITVNGDSVARNESPFLYNTNDQEGVNTGTSNTTKITIPHWAADTLYYYCSAHSGMGSSINVTTDIRKADPYAWKNVLALSLVGYKADVSADINVNSSTKAITTGGDPSASNLTNFYGGSHNFDGNDTLRLSSTNIPKGSSARTIEFWVRINSGYSSWSNIFSYGGSADSQCFGININNNQNANWAFTGYSGGDFDTGVSVAPYVNKWTHVAVTYAGVGSGGALKIYLNGILIGSTTKTLNTTGSTFCIGGSEHSGFSENFTGYISDFRVYEGVVKYASDFVVGSTAPDILPDTPSGITGKTNLAKITDGAVAFNGTGDYLSVPDSDDFDLAGNDWTIETFVYHSSANYASYEGIVAQWVSGSGSSRTWTLETVGAGATSDLEFYYYDTSDNFVGPVQGGTLTKNRWHHVAACRSGNTIRMFVDGVMYGSGTTINVDIKNSTDPLWIGRVVDGYWNGHISNTRVIKGTALYTKNFTPPSAPLTNVTNTKLLCCQSPTSATEAAVTPGSITTSGSPSVTNFNPFTDDINAIRGQETGYATLNPLVLTGGATLSNGNLDILGSTPYRTTPSTIGIKSGKYYWEYSVLYFDGGSTDCHLGICLENFVDFRNTWVLSTNYGWGYTLQGGLGYAGNSQKNLGSSPRTTGDTIAFSFDADEGKLYVYVNGSILNSGNPAYTGLTNGPYYPFVTTGTSAANVSCNFGQKPFKFPPPDGFQPLSLLNAQPDKVIARPDQYVSATLYNGTGNTGNNVSVGFKPDLVWVKRTTSTNWNFWFDSQRGPLKWFSTNERGGESSNTDSLASFDSYGFTVGQDPHADSSTGWNINGQQHIAWCWKAGGGKVGGGGFFKDDVEYASAAAAGLTAGNVTPTSCSIGTDPGLSIIRYTATNSNSALIPHGLGRVPKFLITKKITPNDEWIIHHTDGMSNQQQLYFNTATAAQSNSSIYHSEPTADTFAMGTWAGTNDMITYAFCDVPGFSKFGVYEGTNNPTGEFVELGFRPAVVIIKNLDESWYWTIFDSTRDTYNGSSTMMNFTTNSSQNNSATYNVVDFISNGFKIRGGATNSEPTNNAVTYIYAAWAEAPTVNLYGGHANAR